jgi:hypothetical protein
MCATLILLICELTNFTRFYKILRSPGVWRSKNFWILGHYVNRKSYFNDYTNLWATRNVYIMYTLRVHYIYITYTLCIHYGRLDPLLGHSRWDLSCELVIRGDTQNIPDWCRHLFSSCGCTKNLSQKPNCEFRVLLRRFAATTWKRAKTSLR